MESVARLLALYSPRRRARCLLVLVAPGRMTKPHLHLSPCLSASALNFLRRLLNRQPADPLPLLVHTDPVSRVVGHPELPVDAILEVMVSRGNGCAGGPPAFARAGERERAGEPARESAKKLDGGGGRGEDLELELAGWEGGDHEERVMRSERVDAWMPAARAASR